MTSAARGAVPPLIQPHATEVRRKAAVSGRERRDDQPYSMTLKSEP